MTNDVYLISQNSVSTKIQPDYWNAPIRLLCAPDVFTLHVINDILHCHVTSGTCKVLERQTETSHWETSLFFLASHIRERNRERTNLHVRQVEGNFQNKQLIHTIEALHWAMSVPACEVLQYVKTTTTILCQVQSAYPVCYSTPSLLPKIKPERCYVVLFTTISCTLELATIV